jgi:hypothetical protein
MSDFVLGSVGAAYVTEGDFHGGALGFGFVAPYSGEITELRLQTNGSTHTATSIELGLFDAYPNPYSSSSPRDQLGVASYDATPAPSELISVTIPPAAVTAGEIYFLVGKAHGGYVYFNYSAGPVEVRYAQESDGGPNLADDTVWHSGGGGTYPGPLPFAAYGTIDPDSGGGGDATFTTQSQRSPMTDFELDFELLPADFDEVTPEDQLDSAEDPDSVSVALAASPSVPFGKSWAIDMTTGRFEQFGNTPVMTSGLDSVATWCAIALGTMRFSHPIFSDEFGMQAPASMIGEVDDSTVRATYRADIRETLMVHDRITDVRDFEFFIDPDDEEIMFLFAFVEVDEDDGFALERIPLR